MTIETSTANVLLTAVIALQGWIIRELFKLKGKVSLLTTHCTRCPHNTEFDTDRVSKKTV